MAIRVQVPETTDRFLNKVVTLLLSLRHKRCELRGVLRTLEHPAAFLIVISVPLIRSRCPHFCQHKWTSSFVPVCCLPYLSPAT